MSKKLQHDIDQETTISNSNNNLSGFLILYGGDDCFVIHVLNSFTRSEVTRVCLNVPALVGEEHTTRAG